MYDINVKNVKRGKKFYFLFLSVVFFFLTLLLLWIFIPVKTNLDSFVLSNKVEVKSYVSSEGKIMYSPVYYYQVGEKIYQCNSSFFTSTYISSTSNREIYYDSKNPANCALTSSKNSNVFLIFIFPSLVLFGGLAIIYMYKINKRVKNIQELNKKGKLVKNLPYHMEYTDINGPFHAIYCPVVDYVLPNGNIITLYGDARYDGRLSDQDGKVDLVIDLENPTNYFIDFEINRLTGNLPGDYYKNPKEREEEEIL